MTPKEAIRAGRVISAFFNSFEDAQQFIKKQKPRTRKVATLHHGSSGYYWTWKEPAEYLKWLKPATVNPKRRFLPNREPTLREATDERLMQMADVFRSGHGEHTGKLRYHAGTREVAGRIGGMKAGFPELRHVEESPQRIAAAIQRKKGKTYKQIRWAVRRVLSRDYDDPPKRLGPMVIPPHEPTRQVTGRLYCASCSGFHAKGQHASHGKGSHMRQRNPVRRIVKRKKLRKNSLRPTVIYGKVLRVDAQKTQNHICDAACKRYGHRYTHSFKVKSGARMIGLPNGDLLITSKKR